jgi:sugar phosphate isomerase/epimerase
VGLRRWKLPRDTVRSDQERNMKIEQVAAQLYTLRDHLKTPQQIASTLRKVRRIGYTAVQVSGVGPIDSSELARMLDGEGLICCSTHENGDTILNSPDAVVEKLNILGCTYTAYPHPSKIDLSTPRAVKAFAKRLNNAGRVLHEAGKVLAYHNHDTEFVRMKDRTILEIIFDETDSMFLQAELDTFWVQAGGCDPVAWCRKMKARLPLLHLKDYAIIPDRKRVFAEVGSGNLAWSQIISAADESGCSWYPVEMDADWVDNDPFKSLKRSLQYLKENIAE